MGTYSILLVKPDSKNRNNTVKSLDPEKFLKEFFKEKEISAQLAEVY